MLWEHTGQVGREAACRGFLTVSSAVKTVIRATLGCAGGCGPGVCWAGRIVRNGESSQKLASKLQNWDMTRFYIAAGAGVEVEIYGGHGGGVCIVGTSLLGGVQPGRAVR